MDKKYAIPSMILVVLITIFLGASFYVSTQAAGELYNYADSTKDITIPEFEYQEFDMKNANGDDLEIMFVENLDSDKVILYLHGNSGRTVSLMEDLSMYANVFVPSYPGYGESTGEPDQENIFETVDLSIDYIVNELGFDKSNILIYGHSMGGSPAIYGSVQYGDQIMGTVIVNTFDSIRSMCFNDYYVLCFMLDEFHNSKEMATEMTGKVRQYHSVNDQIVSLAKGVSLSQSIAAPDFEFVEFDGEHSEFDVSKTLEAFEFGNLEDMDDASEMQN